MGQPADIFISYKAEDRPRVKPLVDALEADGFSIWWDAHIGGGTNWRRDIEEHLDAAKCVIVAWTRRSVGPDGEFVRDEAARARRRGTYLPVHFDAVDTPLGFGEVQALSLKGWKGDRADARYHALIHGVRSQITGETSVQRPAQQPKFSRRAVVAGGAGLATIAVAGAGSWLLLKPRAADARRIAVIPFANMSSDQEQAYFADGVAEELRAALSRIGMEVIGRSSSDAVKDLDTKTAAAKLGVANILTGSVRRSPETIRVNAQLIGGEDGVERWAQSYDRAPGDVIKIQTDIAANVARALSIALGQAGRAAIALGGTTDGIAQDLYLKASELRRTADSEESAREALALADAAIARDHNYAEAHVLRALALLDLAGRYAQGPEDLANGFAQSAAAGKRAIELAPRLGFAHATLGVAEMSQLNFVAALRRTRRALALSPDEARVIKSAAQVVASLGDRAEALRLADRLLALDPLEARTFGVRASIFLRTRQYLRSVEAGRRAIKLAPELFTARSAIGDALVLGNRPSEALAEYRRMPSDHAYRLTGEAIVAARSRDFGSMNRTVAHMRALFATAASYQYADIFAQAGDADRVFAELANAIQAKDPGLSDLRVDPFLDPVRADPRFGVLLRQLSFPI
jgi:serine/threonine-protein kinase